MEIHSKQIQPRVYGILVTIFKIIENQSKFASFRTVIDAYLSKNFCITLAHKPLLRIFYSLTNNIYGANTNTEDSLDIENALDSIKSMEYIFKFAFRSRELLSKVLG